MLQTLTFEPAKPRWRRMVDAVRSSWSGPLTSSSPELARYFTDAPSAAGVPVTGDSALTYPAFWAAVSLIAADIASLPLFLYRRLPNGGKERFTDHNLYRLLHDEPNLEMSSLIFRETLQAHLLVWGNAYAEIERDALGRVAALWPLTPNQVQPFRQTFDGPLLYRVTNADGTETVLRAEEVLHIPGLGYDGYMGYSVVGKARESVGLGLAMQQFGATFFANGSTFNGIFMSPRPMGPKEKTDNIAELRKFHQGLDKAHRFVLLEGGLDYKQLGVPPDDAQFLESRSFHISDIARWFKVSPHKLADLSRATFSNIEHLAIDHVVTCLRPWCVRWEQEINRKLIAPQERKIQFVEHLVDGLLRGDLQSRYAAYAVGRQWGWLSADDVLEKENMNPLPNGQGKLYLVPQNMWPADKINQMIDAQTAKAAPPAAEPAAPVDDTAARALEELTKRAALADETLADYRGKLDAADVKVADLTRLFGESDAAVTALRTERDTLAGQVTHLDLMANDLRTQQAQAAAAAEAQVVERQTALDAAHEARTVAEAALAAAVTGRDVDRAAWDAAEVARQANTEALETARADLDAAQTLLQENEARGIAALSTEREARQELEAETERLRADIIVREGSLAAKQEVVIEARQRADRAEAELVDARAAHAKADSQIRDMEAAERERVGAVLSAHRALIVDVMRRMIERETDRARRAQTTPEKLRNWIGTFYPGHEELCVSALLPAIRVHTSWMGRHEDAEVLTRQIVRQHIEESKRQISAVADGDGEELAGSLYQLFTRWDHERSAAIADALLQKEIDRVAT